GERGVKVDVERRIEWVVITLDVEKPTHLIRATGRLADAPVLPCGRAIGQKIEFVEQGCFVPEWPGRIIENGLLPRDNLRAPLIALGQRVPRDLEGVVAFAPVERRIALVPVGAFAGLLVGKT